MQVTGKRSDERELGQLRRRVGVDHAAADVEHRPARVGQRLGGEPDLLLVALGGRLVAGQAHVADRLVVDLRAREVHRHVDQHRARAGPVRAMWNASCTTRGISVGCWIMKRVLDDRHGDAERVRLLEAVGAEQVGADLAGEGDERDRVHHRVGQRRDDVGGARARRSRSTTPTLPDALA